MTMAYNIGSAIGGAVASGIKGFTSGSNVQESRTIYDPLASIYEKGLESNFWRNDTQWYNDKIVGSAYQRARDSLEKAGYNPLMALNNGGLYDQAPVMSGSAMETRTKAQERHMSAERIMDSENALNWAKTDYTSALATSEGIKQIGYTTDNLIKESEKVISDNNAKWIDKRNAEEVKAIATGTQRNIAEIGLVNTQKTLNSAQEGLIRTNNAIAKGQQKYQEEHPLLYTIGKGTADIIPGAAAIGAVGTYAYNKYKTRHKKVGFK